MLRLEWVCHPHRGVCRLVVEDGVVTLATILDLALYGIGIGVVATLCGEFEPRLRGLATCSRGRVWCGRRNLASRVTTPSSILLVDNYVLLA